MSLSKPRDPEVRDAGSPDKAPSNIFTAALQQYARLLREKPILTKSCTSACTGALGNILSQVLILRSSAGSRKHLDLYSILCYAATGFILVGPAMHHYYRLMEEIVPRHVKACSAKRMLIDRLVYTPSFLFVYLFFLCMLEGCGPELAMKKIRLVYWIVYTANLKALTVLQYINLNYVPQQYRVLFGNVVSVFWSCYIATKRSS